MYAILSGGALVALCDKPRYVRLNPDSGCYVEAKPDEAIAVAVNGELYNLGGGTAIPDAPQAVVREEDGAEYVFTNRKTIADAAGKVVGIEDAMCEQDTAAEARLAAIEDALCELDKN